MEVSFNPQAPNPHVWYTIDGNSYGGTNGTVAVSCTSTSQCTAVDNSNDDEITFVPSSGKILSRTFIDPFWGDLVSVSCPPGGGFCTAADGNGVVDTFNPLNPALNASTTHRASVDSIYSGGPVSCTPILCALVDAGGDETAFTPTLSSSDPTQHIDTGGSWGYPPFNGVSCIWNTLCAAVDQEGKEVEFNPQGQYVYSAPVQLAGAPLSGISCSASAFEDMCATVDSTGHAVVGIYGGFDG